MLDIRLTFTVDGRDPVRVDLPGFGRPTISTDLAHWDFPDCADLEELQWFRTFASRMCYQAMERIHQQAQLASQVAVDKAQIKDD